MKKFTHWKNFVWRAFKPVEKKNYCIYQAESVFKTSLLSLNNCKVRANMKTQGIPVLPNPSVFHPVSTGIMIINVSCFIFSYWQQTNKIT